MNRRHAAALLAVAALLLSGCTGEPAPGEEVTASTPPPAAVGPSDDDIEAYIALSCAELIPADLARTLNTAGWEATEPAPWDGEISFADGVMCEWSDGASDPTSFGFARASADEVAAAQEALGEQGWTSEESGAQMLFVSDDSTESYVFGPDGEVRFGSTRDGALAVIAPTT